MRKTIINLQGLPVTKLRRAGGGDYTRVANDPDDRRANSLHDPHVYGKGRNHIRVKKDDTGEVYYECSKNALLSEKLEDIGGGEGGKAPRQSARSKSQYAFDRQPPDNLREHGGAVNTHNHSSSQDCPKIMRLRGFLSEAKRGTTLDKGRDAACVGSCSTTVGEGVLE